MRCSYPPYSGRYIAGRTVVRLVGWLVHMSYLYYKSPNLKSLVCNAHQPLIMAGTGVRRLSPPYSLIPVGLAIRQNCLISSYISLHHWPTSVHDVRTRICERAEATRTPLFQLAFRF